MFTKWIKQLIHDALIPMYERIGAIETSLANTMDKVDQLADDVAELQEKCG